MRGRHSWRPFSVKKSFFAAKRQLYKLRREEKKGHSDDEISEKAAYTVSDRVG
jgi:hypothetical protein